MSRGHFLALISSAMFVAMPLGAASAITLETTNFISSPTYFNGFEGFGTTGTVAGESYSEGGIKVTAVGRGAPAVPGFTPAWGGVGANNWFGDVNYSYVDITLTGGGQFQALQFLASTGYSESVATTFAYEVLNAGSVIASGTTAFSAFCCGPGRGYQYLGFSGGGFDALTK